MSFLAQIIKRVYAFEQVALTNFRDWQILMCTHSGHISGRISFRCLFARTGRAWQADMGAILTFFFVLGTCPLLTKPRESRVVIRAHGIW